MPKSRIITLLTDFGDEDWFVAAVKGEILKVLPEARIVDLSHRIRPHDVRSAAFALWAVHRCFPESTVHLAVVDPGVGGKRQPLVVRAAGQIFVGPDNGVFSYVYADFPHTVYRIKQTQGLSRTFHGRDIFAPIAARLAAGTRIAALAVPTGKYQRFEFPSMKKLKHRIVGQIVYVDHFGNAITNIAPADAADELGHFLVKGRCIPIVSHYGAARKGELLAIEDSTGFYEICVREGSAARMLRLAAGARVDYILTSGRSRIE